MYHIWGSGQFPESAQVKLFEAAVVSVLTYGCEVWVMDKEMQGKLQQWCARCTVHITGRTIQEEYKSPTFPIIKKIMKRRFDWLGHQLRRSGSLVQTALKVLAQDYLDGEITAGSIIQEAPLFKSVDELLEMAEDRELWNGASNKMFCIR